MWSIGQRCDKTSRVLFLSVLHATVAKPISRSNPSSITPPLTFPSVGADIFDWNNHQYLVIGGFLLWLVRDGFTAWELLKDSDLQDEAPVFDSRHSREAVNRQWQAVRQPWIWAVCQGMELCTHYKQPILCTVKRLGSKKLSSKQNSCWRNSEKMGLMFSWVSWTCGTHQEMAWVLQPSVCSPDAPAPQSPHQRSCWNPSHWARPGSQPSWRKSANSRNNTTTSQHDISGLWNPMKRYACRQTKASRDSQWWSQLEIVPGHT